MTFELDYNKHILFAETFIKNKKLNVCPADLVNDAYIRFIERDEPYLSSTIRGLITSFGFKELSDQYSNISFDEMLIPKSRRVDRHSFMCKGCGEIMDQDFFRRSKVVGGISFFTGKCKKCLNKDTGQWFKNNKERWNAYVKERYRLSRLHTPKKIAQPIHELWNRANKKRYEKEKELLLDSYIIRLLKASKMEVSPKTIKEKREKIIQTRQI